jgi:acyl-CoA synthetase (AMP-forming)/AMP-acid ligase II
MNASSSTQRDVSGWSTRLTADAISQYSRSGAWQGLTLLDHARRRFSADPSRIVAVEGAGELTVSRLIAEASRLLKVFRRFGLLPGDVVSFQLPNWLESMALNLACCMGGYVCNPIVPIYRAAEVRFILRDAKSKILFVPKIFRSFDFAGMAHSLRIESPYLRAVICVRGMSEGCLPYDDLELEATEEGPAPVSPDPNAVKLLIYTSGTTGKPKGVLHSHNTLSSELAAIASFWSLSASDVIFMPSPVTHVTGYLYALEAALTIGCQVVLVDRWDADQAVTLIKRHRASVCIGATPFLVELTNAAVRRAERLPSLRRFVTGGAPVPPQAINRANEHFANCLAFRVYGSSEVPTVSLGIATRKDLVLAATSEGKVVNNEVRIVDAANRVLLPGRAGEICVRGPEVMLGYTDAVSTEDAFDTDGFFHTGDLGVLTNDGVLTIVGRQKDMIIRGGENISPKEIEDSLHRHPLILEVAVVAIPHPRLGESVCACIICAGDATIDVANVAAFLDDQSMAKQKWPERIELMAEFPRTASGKIQKNVLRERVAKIIASESTHVGN